MYEKLIENRLTNANELSYQIPFCEVLLAHRYSVLHISSHGPGEHGKDVIARHLDGRLFAFQLKGDDIRLSDWRRIRGEVEELVRLPVRHPSVEDGETHYPVLVTNGEVLGDATENIKQFSDKWQRDGAEWLDVWGGKKLQRLFIDAHGSYLPTDIGDLRDFLQLFAGEFEDRLPREEFTQFVERLTEACTTKGSKAAKKRAVESMVLLASYVVEQYERAKNHIAAAEGWTVVAMNILRVVEREGLSPRDYESSLNLVEMALTKNLQNFLDEVLQLDHLVQSNFILAEPAVYNVRVTLVLGWLAASALLQRHTGEIRASNKEIRSFIKREFRNMRISGEADWPMYLLIALYLGKEHGSSVTESLIEEWLEAVVKANSGKNPEGIPSPYWLQEKVIALRVGELPPYEKEKFVGHSYTTLSAMDMLVRRFRRQAVRLLWSRVSKIKFCEFVPKRPHDWFLWRCEEGKFHTYDPIPRVSWSSWREEASTMESSLFPRTLLSHKEWVLPFVLTYPHRLNRGLTALVDGVYGGRVEIVEQAEETDNSEE